MEAGFLWVAVSAGALALLTPCVFPLIPIAVSYFSHSGGRDRRGTIRRAAFFAGGIIATFTAIGLAVAVLVGAAGLSRFAANPWVNLAIAGMFSGFAFSLLGYYEIKVPAAILNRLDRLTRERESSEAVAAVLMGGTFALTSFTCTAPFVGTLLVLASQGEWQRPVVGLLAFSTVFSLPFFFLALVPRAMARLPRSGAWLNSVKVVLGLIEIGAALKFVSNADLVFGWQIFTRQVLLASWALIAAVIAVYLLGFISFRHDTPVGKVRPARIAFVGGFLAVGGLFALGLDGRPLGEIEAFLPPRASDTPSGMLSARESGESSKELAWHWNDMNAALAEAKASGHRVFIDFTGYTCTNCRWMESNMFTVPEVKELLGEFVLARLYTDGEGEIYEEQMEYQKNQFGTIALPLYAVVDAHGKTVATFLGLTRRREEFLKFLREALG